MSGLHSKRRIPRQMRSRQTLDAILDATATLLVQVGYEGVNTNAVAAQAGVKPPAVYRYFPNKFALYLALAEKLQNELHQDLAEALKGPDAPLDALVSRVIEAAAGFWVRRPAFSALWQGEWSIQGDPSPGRLFADQTVEKLIALTDRFRGLGPERERLVLTVAMHISIALVDAAAKCPPADRDGLLSEAKRAVVAYLLPVQATLR